MISRLLPVALSLIFMNSVYAINSSDLVPEAKRLYSKLEPSDPQRVPVALRLADLLFDTAIEISGDAQATPSQMKLSDDYRKESLKLYEMNLSHVQGEQALRVRFQISRLAADLGQLDKARAIWASLSQQKTDVRIRRESSLRLAEQWELSNSKDKLHAAKQLYLSALPLADKQSLRAYTLFRLSWARYRLGETDSAIQTIREAIRLSDASSQGDMAKDLILFLSRSSHSASDALAMAQGYEKELKRDDLGPLLAEALAVADRREDYAFVLIQLDRDQKALERSVFLLDLRQDRMPAADIRMQLEQLAKLKQKGVKFSNAALEDKSNAVYYRLMMLWDGERRASRQGYSEVFTDGVRTALILFPDKAETERLLSGWIAANPDREAQVAKLEEWIQVSRKNKSKVLELRLRQTRLEAARELKRWPIVVTEASVVAMEAEPKAARAAKYQQAKALYEMKDYTAALPIFDSIADSAQSDELVRFSQDLSLDILAGQKNYLGIRERTAKWKAAGERAAELATLGEKARFEQAVSQKNSESLKTFTEFCVNKKFKPMACDNARALAISLKDRRSLMVILRAQGDDKELAKQLEIAGDFEASARLLEKNLDKADAQGAFKVAMLYELQGNLKERNRVLNTLVGRWASSKQTLSMSEQTLLYQSLLESDLLTDATLKLPFSDELKQKIAGQLALRRPSKAADKQLLASCKGEGEAWERVHTERIEKIYVQQKNVHFFGAGSQRRFKERVKLLASLGEAVDCFRQGASLDRSSWASQKVGQAYDEFVVEIRSAPIPEGLDAETLAQVHEQISTTSAPFVALADRWKATAEKESAGVRASPTPEAIPKAVATKPLRFDWKNELLALQANPSSPEALIQLQNHFLEIGSPRLAAYMRGRLEGLERQ